MQVRRFKEEVSVPLSGCEGQ